MHFTKSAALSPPRARAQPAVGNTWLLPLDIIAERLRAPGPRKTVPAALHFIRAIDFAILRQAQMFRRETVDKRRKLPSSKAPTESRRHLRAETVRGLSSAIPEVAPRLSRCVLIRKIRAKW